MNKKEKITISRDLLESIREDIFELLNRDEWRRNSTWTNKRYLQILEEEIKQIDELLKD